MAYRLVEIVLPEEKRSEAESLLRDSHVLNVWCDILSDRQTLIRVFISADEAEGVLDKLQERFMNVDGFRIMLLPVEASIPRPEPKREPMTEHVQPLPETERKAAVKRLSREELYTDVAETTKLTTVYAVLVVLSTIVAAIGIINDNVAVIIGAMVIAPLLGPNVALSFATTLGDIKLAHNALRTNIAGMFIALVCSSLLGYILAIDPNLPWIAAKTSVNLGDIGIALASGTAGALAFTTGISTALVGVMVAVALLPPLVTFGLLIGSGYFELSVGALLLLLTNIICINLAGVVTFLLRGIRPLTWWEADKAKRATNTAIVLWVLSLMALVVVIALSQKR